MAIPISILNETAADAPGTRDVPAFSDGIPSFRDGLPDLQRLGAEACLSGACPAIEDPRAERAVYQTLIAADALRYLTLLMTAAKSSGHPGGFASAADVHAAIVMLGHTGIFTDVGHHAPGFYSQLFLDTSLEAMDIRTVRQLCGRFREMDGLPGHPSVRVPGVLGPSGPLGQGQHFAMSAALLHRDRLFPVTIGDGGMGEPYVLASMLHFRTAYPSVTNFLPVLVWNGYSQEHHSMASTWTNGRMREYWTAHGFESVAIVDARDFDDRGQSGPYVDSTLFSWPRRLAFTGALLETVHDAAGRARNGESAVVIVKQLKGAGGHAAGAASHHLAAGQSPETPALKTALERRALPALAWRTVRENFRHAGGGPASRAVITEFELPPPPLGRLPIREFAPGAGETPTTALGNLAAAVGRRDPRFLVTGADGNAASGLADLNRTLTIRHPTPDDSCVQGPGGRVYEPVSEDACAGLAAGVALFGGRSLWVTYEAFAANGLPVWQTSVQAMAELRRPAPSAVCLLTAGALEQGRNGWTHQRPEVEAHLGAMLRQGNVYLLFPVDANMIQAAYAWALRTQNKGIAIVASKNALPVRTTLAQSRAAVEQGAIALYESSGPGPAVVFAVAGDTVLDSVFEAARALERRGLGVRIVSVVNPRRLYRGQDIAWQSSTRADGRFMDRRSFDGLFGGDVLIGVAGGSGLALEPVMLRTRAASRDLVCWKRGGTVSCTSESLAANGLDAGALSRRALALVDGLSGAAFTGASHES